MREKTLPDDRKIWWGKKLDELCLLKKYISDNGKIISSKITMVSYNKQKKLTREIKKARILALI